jgi:hypothetical protein
MIRAGIPEGIVMEIIGHKTRAMLERYNIKNTNDLRQAAKKMTGIVPGIVELKREEV